MLHAECLGHSGQMLELDDGTVFAHLFNLFAILDVDVRRLVLLVVFDGEAVAFVAHRTIFMLKRLQS